MNKIDRFKILIRYAKSLGIASSQEEFGKLMGYTNPSAFSQVINGKSKEPKEFSKKMCSLVPESNFNWLEYGEGDMLGTNTTTITQNNVNGNNNYVGNGSINTHVPTHTCTCEDACVPSVPVIPRNVCEASDVDVYEYIEANDVPMTPKVCQFPAHDAFYVVYGDEMEPYFLPGDKLAISPYEQGNERKLLNGRTYLVDTKHNGLMLRRLYKVDEGFRAIALNEQYGEELIEMEDVIRVYRILGLLRTNC